MSFHKSIVQTLIFGQFLGLMPISGITSDAIDLRFKWKTFRFLYCIIITFLAFLLLLSFAIWFIIHNKFTLDNINILAIYFTHIITIFMFFKLGKRWPELINMWTELERSFPASSRGNYLYHQLNLRLIVTSLFSISKLILTWISR